MTGINSIEGLFEAMGMEEDTHSDTLEENVEQGIVTYEPGFEPEEPQEEEEEQEPVEEPAPIEPEPEPEKGLWVATNEEGFITEWTSQEYEGATFIHESDLVDGLEMNLLGYKLIGDELIEDAAFIEAEQEKLEIENIERDPHHQVDKLRQEKQELEVKLDLVDEVVIMMLDEKFAEPESEPEPAIMPMMFSMTASPLSSNPTTPVPDIYISLYARHVIEGKREIGQVPSVIRDLVINKINEIK